MFLPTRRKAREPWRHLWRDQFSKHLENGPLQIRILCYRCTWILLYFVCNLKVENKFLQDRPAPRTTYYLTSLELERLICHGLFRRPTWTKKWHTSCMSWKMTEWSKRLLLMRPCMNTASKDVTVRITVLPSFQWMKLEQVPTPPTFLYQETVEVSNITGPKPANWEGGHFWQKPTIKNHVRDACTMV